MFTDIQTTLNLISRLSIIKDVPTENNQKCLITPPILVSPPYKIEASLSTQNVFKQQGG